MEQEHFSAHETINAGRQGKNTVHTHANYNKSVLLVEKDANTTITTHANSVQVFEYEDQVIITRSDPTNHSALKEAGPIGKNSKQNGNPFADRLSLDAANIGKPQQSIDVPTLPNAEIIGSLNISSNEINTQDKNVSLVDNGPMRTKDNVTGGGNAIKSGANTAHAVETLVTGEKSDPQDYETQIVKLTHKSKGENTTTGDDEATGHYEFEEAVVIHRPGSKRASAFSFGTP